MDVLILWILQDLTPMRRGMPTHPTIRSCGIQVCLRKVSVMMANARLIVTLGLLVGESSGRLPTRLPLDSFLQHLNAISHYEGRHIWILLGGQQAMLRKPRCPASERRIDALLSSDFWQIRMQCLNNLVCDRLPVQGDRAGPKTNGSPMGHFVFVWSMEILPTVVMSPTL